MIGSFAQFFANAFRAASLSYLVVASFQTLSYVDPALLTGQAVECHKLVFSLAYRKRHGLEFMTTILVEKQDVPGKSISHSVGPALHSFLLYTVPCQCLKSITAGGM